jgi:pyruvate,water dikinase
MHALFSYIKRLFYQPPPPTPEQLREEFTQKYKQFRSLLTANNNALQAMAELERIYYGGDSYRMAAVRSKVTTILVNVYKMVKNLLAMSPGQYGELEKRFEAISASIEEILERKPQHPDGPLVFPLAAIGKKHASLVGEKMANLGEVSRLSGCQLPPGFVITATATRMLIPPSSLDEINRILQQLDPEKFTDLLKGCDAIRDIILSTPVPAELEAAILTEYRKLEEASEDGIRVALRSSGFGEDSIGVSFAGLYKTVLDVERHGILFAYKEVIASKYGPRAISYRRRRGFRHEDIEMCVGCMVMVDAVVSGVMYSGDPEDEHGLMMRINCTQGIAKGVVDGTTPTDLYLVSRSAPHQLLETSLRQATGSGDQPAPLLAVEQVVKLAVAAMQLEHHFGCPQDIEWSFDAQGRLFILQSRPLMAKKRPDADEEGSPAATVGEPPLLSGGICCSGGIGSGPIFQLESADGMGQFPTGGVLVVSHPLPEWAPLLPRAAAIIAEQGSEAGHLATIAREFSIPAIFSLPHAKQQLREGSTVTVHGNMRAIFAGRREDLLRQNRVKRDLMAGSPVQRLLTEALQFITPLNLNDPASTRFKASWCETLHDITRYCHEKSVVEMFDVDRHRQFSRASARQLVGDVPLEWWVINLADGFREDYDERLRTVRIENICSVPMLAIWRGISAYPWEGPPPVSMSGFGSIIFQSVMRPELDPSVASRLNVKNYFLISKNFCNLSVRLGYHYAMIEAFLSELKTESYITFRFKGGAADLNRKAVRAKLLADILKRYDFRIELRSDALLARIKMAAPDYLEQRLQILGYLTLHARQLDMVMTQSGAVERYRGKFIDEIEAMLARYPNSAEPQFS